jgi:hypothetical protein
VADPLGRRSNQSAASRRQALSNSRNCDESVRGLVGIETNVSTKISIYQTHPGLRGGLAHDLRPRRDGAIADGGADTCALARGECANGAFYKYTFGKCTCHGPAANQRPGPEAGGQAREAEAADGGP